VKRRAATITNETATISRTKSFTAKPATDVGGDGGGTAVVVFSDDDEAAAAQLVSIHNMRPPLPMLRLLCDGVAFIAALR
jgi:hypothetical protein